MGKRKQSDMVWTCATVYIRAVFHTIEAQRLATKLVSVSKQIHGEDHAVTKETEEYLSGVKRRCVAFVKSASCFQMFEAIRYEEGDNMLIIQGPLSNKFGLDLHKQRNIEAGTMSDVIHWRAICLVSMARLVR